MRRASSGPAALLAALLAGCAGPASSPETDLRPNVLIVLVDALRADRLGVNGYPLPTTPWIDGLAAEGVNFSHAFAHSTWTKPSIATLFSCLYPSQHGLVRVGEEGEEGFLVEVMVRRLITLAERFAAAGYATGAVVNQVHLQDRFGFDQGFDLYLAVRGQGAYRLNRKLLTWLEGLEGGPFFAYLHYLDVHWPYDRRLDGQEGLFGPTELTPPPPRSAGRVEAWAADLEEGPRLDALRARYDHEVAFADAAVGALLERMRELGLYENTVVVVTSDHGEGFLEHGRLQHGYGPYEELLQIPLVIRLPESLRTRTGNLDAPVGLIDLMPTLLELAGLEPESQCSGESVAAAIRGGEAPERSIFTDALDAFAARGRAHKLIWFDDGRTEFFDLAADPGERSPLPPPCRGACRELAAQLRSFRELMLEARERSPAARAVMTPEEVETLRALGYVE